MNVRFALCTVGVVSAAMFAPVTSAVAYTEADCSVKPASIQYEGDNRVFYSSYSSSVWQITTTTYKFSPANSNSTHNNQNFTISSKSGSRSFTSNDDLIRDNTWRTDTKGGVYFTDKGSTQVHWTDIFDVPNYSDPRCDVYTPKF